MMKRLTLLLLLLAPLPARAAEAQALPRTLVALYDSRQSADPRSTQIHRFLEMPANHLGFDIHYYDINAPLPPLGPEVRGVVLWFDSGMEAPDFGAYLDWLDKVVAAGKKLVIIENAGFGDKAHADSAVMQRYNHVLSHIGIQDTGGWHRLTYNARMLTIDKTLAGFERTIGPVLPPFGDMRIIPGRATSHLTMRVQNEDDFDDVDLITTNPNGGYISEDYAIFYVVENDQSRISQWFVNPFRFLRLALGEADAPIPDITTLDGKRIFYSHIDGDGWNNISEIERYNATGTLSAEVIEKEVLKPYSDFAFTVGLITSDVDPDCYGLKDSERVARDIFATPNVEPASHTHSHPLFWRYFENYTPEKEQPVLNLYPARPKQASSLVEDIKSQTMGGQWSAGGNGHAHAGDTKPEHLGRNDESEAEILHKYYRTPRSYACSAFNLDDEVAGAARQINALAPAGKRVRLLQWSGDTTPFEGAIKAAREAGLYNINGGDSRFDSEYPSYSSVAPIGIAIGGERQIYSSNSNENTYTNLWTGRFFGFRYLQTTIANTESPMRVRPFNLYFHIYSGEKAASLKAVKENLDFARTQDVVPITASDYTAIAQGFYDTRLLPLSPQRWRIENRGELQTLRFDDTENKAVDFAASKGVVGQRYLQGSLYVGLDPAEPQPEIQLKPRGSKDIIPKESMPYLIESRWPIKNLHNGKTLLTCNARGYGVGSMRWMMPKSGNYLVKAQRNDADKSVVFEQRVTTLPDGTLSFDLPTDGTPGDVTLTIGE